MIDPENIAYLEKIAEQVITMDDAKQNTVEYLITKQIKDKEKIENCIIISQIWAAYMLGKNINMEDLLISLGSETDTMPAKELCKEVELDEKYQGLPLRRILDIVIEAKGSVL